MNEIQIAEVLEALEKFKVGTIEVNFRNHDGEHRVDLYDIWPDELKEILRKIV